MLSEQINLNYRPFTYIKRGVPRSSKIINVGNPKRLDGHRAHTEEQLSDGHEHPQVVSVRQTPGVVSAAVRFARVPVIGREVANVMAIWIAAGDETQTERRG